MRAGFAALRCAAALSLGVAALAVAPQSTARAEGESTQQIARSVWGRAANPARARMADTVEQVDALLSEYLHLRRAPASFRPAQLLHKARRLLQGAGAASLKNPEVRYRVAQVTYGLFEVEREQERLSEAAEHLDFVARSGAPVTVRAEALNDLAICYARLGRHDEEIAAYSEALAIQPHAETRAVLLANRAEGYMVRGEILSAVRGYRASLNETPASMVSRSAVTTLWGLAVALDRSGDLGGALERITVARTYDPIDALLNGPTWFYVPEYDDSWYHALGHWQRAQNSDDHDVRVASYRKAIRSWQAFLDRAPDSNRWLALASLRLRQCERELGRELAGKPLQRKRP